MKKIFYIAFSILAFAACSKFNNPEFIPIEELVAKSGTITVAQEGGTGSVLVYSSGNVTVRQLNDVGDWATINKTSFTGDDTLKVVFAPNTGFRRMMAVELSLEGTDKLDTIRFKQEGTVAYLECASPFRTVNGAAEETVTFEMNTNINLDEANSVVEYISGGKNWITSISATEDTLYLSTAKSSVDIMSKARIDVNFIDGWGTALNVKLIVNSSDKDGEFGTEKTFDEIKALAGTTISGEYYIKGVIISDCESKNLDLNPSISHDVVDVTENNKTAYIETEDGSAGFRLKFEEESDNTLKPGTLITLGLNGSSISKDEELDCYTISNLTIEDMLKSEVSTVPVKVRKISELTDADINTFVEIPNTEFVWKTGSYINIYENYALRSAINYPICSGCNNRFDGWAALMIDADGNTIYAPINTLCLWRRSGDGVPQGVGSTKGIIVHNVMKRYGDIGKYQIRVLDESGFCQEWDGKPNYVDYAEWDGSPHQNKFSVLEGFNSKYSLTTQTSAGFTAILPSDDISAEKTIPNGEMSFQIAQPKSNLSYYYSHCSKVVTNSGAGDRGRASAGQGKDTFSIALQLNNDIKGYYNWDGNQITGTNGITMKISTKDLTGTKMVFAYAFCVGEITAATSRFFPAHWFVEYSIDGGKNYTACPEAVTGKEYVHLRALPWYDINIGGIKYFSCSSCGLGATEHLVVLPDDVFGNDDVRIRLRPYDDVMAIFPVNWDGDVETSHVYSTSSAQVYFNLEYAAIRYQKTTE